MRSRDDTVSLDLKGTFTDQLPADSIFGSLDETSNFFEKGSLGYSATRENKHLDGITLETKEWIVKPFDISTVSSSFYNDKTLFPDGTIEFDHALLMQNVDHEWHSAPDYDLPQ